MRTLIAERLCALCGRWIGSLNVMEVVLQGSVRALLSIRPDPKESVSARSRIHHRFLLPARPLVFGRHESAGPLGNGQAIGRDADGTVSKTRSRSRSRPGLQSVLSPRRSIPVETQPPPFDARSDNGPWTGRRV